MTVLALMLLVLLMVTHGTRDAEATTPASEKCVVTYDTYVAGHKVLAGGRYCVPWP